MKLSRRLFLSKLGTAIRKKRLKLGTTQTDLADDADITQKYLCEIEAGKRNPSVDCTRRICEALRTNMVGLFKLVK